LYSSSRESARSKRQHEVFSQANSGRRMPQVASTGAAPGSERGTAGLAAKGLDSLGLTMLAIADQRMDVRIGDRKVQALRVGTSEPFGVDAFGGSPPTFHLTPGA
jgi:hypothetical protein